MADLSPGEIVWLAPDPIVGREQAGRRPAIVVSGQKYLDFTDSLAIVVPLTSVDRSWPNHVRILGGKLKTDSWAMTEQVRAVSRERIQLSAGHASEVTLAAIRTWLGDFLDLRRQPRPLHRRR